MLLYREFASLVARCLDAGVTPESLHGAVTVAVVRKLTEELKVHTEKARS
jgi:hypothetical protein